MAFQRKDSTGDSRCFVCDEIITGTCFPLVVGVTPYSKTDLPTKIGQLMGDGFMVVVSEDDNLCKRCTSLLHQLDRLEVDLNLVKDALTTYLKVKYRLNEEDNEISTCKSDTNFLLYNERENGNDKSSCKKLCGKEGKIAGHDEFKDGCENSPEKSNMATESPKKVNVEIILDERLQNRRRKKKRNTTDTSMVLNDDQSHSTNKEYKCSLYEQTIPDITVYNSHSCTKYEGVICGKDYESSHGTEKHVKNIHSVELRCPICNIVFKEENMFISHTQTHSHNNMVHHTLQNEQSVESKRNIFMSGVYTCSICTYKTESAIAYRDHQQVHFQNPSEYNSSHKSLLRRSDGKKSSSHKTSDHCINSTKKVSEQTITDEESTCNLEAAIVKDRITDTSSNILLEEDKASVDTNYKITESQEVSADDRISNVEHYFCSTCCLAFPSVRLLHHHKNMYHMLPSLRKDTLPTTETANNNNNNCDLQQKGCLDTDKSSNLKVSDENLTDILKNVSTQFMQVANRKYSNLFGTALASEHVPDRVTSNSSNCTKIDSDFSLPNNGKIDCIASGKTKQLSAATHNPVFENSNEHLLTPHESHLSETSEKDNSFQCNFTSGETDSAANEEENSEKNINHNASLEDLLNVSFRDIQQSTLISENETEHTRQKGCERKAKTDNEESQLGSSGTQRFQPLIMKNLRASFLFNATKIGIPQCENCGKLFSSNNKMLYHRDICLRNLSCKLCNKPFLSVTDLQKHNSEKHQTHEMHHNCMYCSMSFQTKELCLAHEEKCDFALYCDECGETFAKVDQLRSHKVTIHRDPHCRYCGKEILKLKTLQNHELRHVKEAEKKFECSECKKLFKTKTGLRHHFALHTGQYKFCCDYCGRGFMSRMMMEEHRSKHTKEERYICDVCGRKFCFQSTYWIHRKWHDNPFPYKCTFCGRKFRHSSLLSVHKRKHTGERPYKCPHCPLTFPVGGTLKRHIILHTGVYPYNCEGCKRGFTTRHKFALHLSKVHGDSKMLNEKSRPNEYKMVIKDNKTVKKQNNVEPSADWQTPGDSEQVDINFRLGNSAGSVDNFEHLEGGMSCSLVPDELLVGNAFATRVVEIVLDDTSQAVAAVTVADSEANSLPDLW